MSSVCATSRRACPHVGVIAVPLVVEGGEVGHVIITCFSLTPKLNFKNSEGMFTTLSTLTHPPKTLLLGLNSSLLLSKQVLREHDLSRN